MRLCAFAVKDLIILCDLVSIKNSTKRFIFNQSNLLEKEIFVGEVSEMVGFGSVSYFSKSFFEEFGVKPSHYIKK
jgi:hypothetical protein